VSDAFRLLLILGSTVLATLVVQRIWDARRGGRRDAR